MKRVGSRKSGRDVRTGAGMEARVPQGDSAAFFLGLDIHGL